MKRIWLLLSVLLSVLLTGCSAFSREGGSTELPTKIDVKSVGQLENGNYYVMKEGEDGTTFSSLYWFDRNHKDPTQIAGRANPQKVLWYHEDWDAVPTLYKGDKLVLRNTESIPESFTFERYKYLGYTLGISGITQNRAGNYVFNTSSKSLYLSRYSASAVLNRFDSNNIVLYSIGGVSNLGYGNFSEAGTIAGLEKDTKYKCIFYKGTKKYEMSLPADTVALNSMEVQSSNRARFIDEDLIEIIIPSEFNSGYYCVNNGGVFRYVNGTDYSDNTDFNIPNDIVTQGAVEEEGNTNYEDDTQQTGENEYTIEVSTPRTVSISITYSTPKDGKFYKDPVVKLIGPDSTRTIEKDKKSESFKTSIELPVGTYTLQIQNLDGRKADVNIK